MPSKILIPFLIAGAALPSMAHAGTMDFAQHVYAGLDELNSDHPDPYSAAISAFETARVWAENERSKEEIRQAVLLLSRHLSSQNTPHPSDTDVATAVQHARNSLHENRPVLNRSNQNESRLMEALVLARLFPEAASEVRIAARGLERDQAVLLLSLYLNDERAAQYDPDVQQLLEGDSNDFGISFFLPTETYEIPEGKDAAWLTQSINDMKWEMARQGLPLRLHANQNENQIALTVEVVGLKYAPIVESYMRNVLVWAGGNRHVFRLANRLEAWSRSLDAAYLGSQTVLQAAAKRLGSGISSVEQVMRTRLVAGRWYTAEPKDVLERLQKMTASRIEHIQMRMKQEMDAATAAGRSASEVAEIEAEYTNMVVDQQKKIQAAEAAISSAVQGAEATPEFASLTAHEKDAFRLAKAEEAAKGYCEKGTRCRMITIDRALKTVSFAIAAYYAYDWYMQVQRVDASDHKTRNKVHGEYAVKLINTLVYAVPVLGEGAAAIDFIGWGVENTVFKMAGVDYDIPDVGDMLRWGWRFGRNRYYRLKGSSSFLEAEKDVERELKIGPDLYLAANQMWFDSESAAVYRVMQTGMRITQERRAQFLNHVRVLAQKKLSALMMLSDQYGNRKDRELAQYEQRQLTELVKTGGYLRVSEALLRNSAFQQAEDAQATIAP